jgi:hypothetical protein
VIGQVVLLRLADQYTLAAITAEYTSDDVDLRAFALFGDGTIGLVDIPHAMRGVKVDQWAEPPPYPTPEPVAAAIPKLAEVKPNLMHASSMPPLPPQPMMVIIRY